MRSSREKWCLFGPACKSFTHAYCGLGMLAQLIQLLDCLDDIKAWMSLNFLSFNENKTEVMVFGGTTGTPLVDLGALAQYIKPTITNLTLILSSTVRSGQ